MKKELTLEELMLIAKKPVKDPKEFNKHLRPAKRFIISCDVKFKENSFVPAFIIYDRYERWCQLNDIKPVTVTAFFSEFKIYFKQIKKRDYIVYEIDSEGFDLSEENIAFLKQKRISDGESKNKKKKSNKKTK